MTTPIAIGSTITTVTVDNTVASAQTNVPITFGQPFAVGDLPAASAAVELKLADNLIVPAQLDVKATHADGSVRHALISAVLPTMAASESKTLSILRKAQPAAGTVPTLASHIAAGLQATVSIIDAGVTYSVSLSSLVGAANLAKWLNGPIANEWIVSAPLVSAGSVEHPLIHARFAVRVYAGLNRAKLDITLENSWVIPNPASVAGGNVWVANNPSNVTYDVAVAVPGDAGYTQAGLVHFNKTRWTRTYWWNSASPAHVRHNIPYVLRSKAVPNYDQTLALNPTTVSNYVTKLASNDAPMKPGVIYPAMGGTGGRPDIGIHPGWCVNWLLSGDKSMKDVSVRSSVQSGAFTVCYRNKATDNWVSVAQYPYACLAVGSSSDDLNPTSGKHEKVPAPAVASGNPNTPNSYHQVSQSYIPYLLTGDFAHLEMLQAWNEWTALNITPGYRAFGNGGIYHDEPRGVAWMLRTLAQTAYISPDGDAVKSRALTALDYNLDYFNTKHTNSSDPETGNALGFLHNPIEGSATKYPHPITGVASLAIAPWQDDFFTAAVGMTAELGFAKAKPLMAWKAKFPVGRMTRSGTDYCWVLGCVYEMAVRSTASGPIYTSWGDVWENTAPAAVKAAACGSQAMADACTTAFGDYSPYVIGQMVRYAPGDDGYVANAQPAFAYTADSDHPQGDDVWLVYDGRAKKQVFSDPQFAIVPRIQESIALSVPPDIYSVATGLPIYGGRAAPATSANTLAGTFDSVSFVNTTDGPPSAVHLGTPLQVSLHGSGGSNYTSGRQYTAAVSGPMAYSTETSFSYMLAATTENGKNFLSLRPNDNYGSTTNGRRESFWAGFKNMGDQKVHLITVRRLDTMMEWALANLSPTYDLTRMSLTGGSMGAGGCFTWALKRPQWFTAIYSDRGRWRFAHVANEIVVIDWVSGTSNVAANASPLIADEDGGGTQAQWQDGIAWAANTAHKLPWIGWCIGRSDGDYPFQDSIDAVATLRARKAGFCFAWNSGDHGAATSAQMTNMRISYPHDLFVLGKSYPYFSEHSRDNDPSVHKAGTINGGLTFRNVVDTVNGWSCEVTSVTPTSSSGVTVAGSTTTVIQLPTTESLITNDYVGGTLTINGETRNVIAYDGTDPIINGAAALPKLATVSPAFTTAPAAGTPYTITRPHYPCTVKVEPCNPVAYPAGATAKTVTITAPNTWASVSFP